MGGTCDFLRVRYARLHRPMWDELTSGPSERELRGRPHPRANTIVWLVWHIARVEDLGVNRFVVDGRQVMDRGDWATRMRVTRRDVGTGMTDAEVDALSAAIDLAELRRYWDAVIDGTLAVVDTLAGEDLDTIVQRIASGASRTMKAASRKVPSGSPNSGLRAGRARGCSDRRRSCTRTVITSRRGPSAACGDARASDRVVPTTAQRSSQAAMRRPP